MPSSRSSSSSSYLSSSSSLSSHSHSHPHGLRFNVKSDSDEWVTRRKKLPRRLPASLRFLSYAAGRPADATMVVKQTRDSPDYHSVRSSSSSRSSQTEERMYWTREPEYRSSSTIRSSISGGVRHRPFVHNGPPPGFAVPTDGHHVPPPPMAPGVPLGGMPMPPAPAPRPAPGVHFGNGPVGPPPGGMRPPGPGGFGPAMPMPMGGARPGFPMR